MGMPPYLYTEKERERKSIKRNLALKLHTKAQISI